MSTIFTRHGVYYYKNVTQRFSLKTKDRKIARKLQREYDQRFALEIITDGTSTKQKEITFGAAKTEYLRFKEQKFAYRTFQTDKQRLEWLYNFTGNIPLKKLSLDVILDYVEIRPSTIRITLIVTKAFLNYCRKRNYIRAPSTQSRQRGQLSRWISVSAELMPLV